MFTRTVLAISLWSSAALAAGEAKNVIFFLGDGMGPTAVTATRIYQVGEDGKLTMETLPHTARVITYSLDAQTTDSAPSMSAYMTGVKMRNEVISMSADTIAQPTDSVTNNCGDHNGSAVTTLLEMAKAKGKAVGAVTSTRVTHATPAATYAHICHRDLENDIAAQLVPEGAGYNHALGDGMDVLFGGGRNNFLPKAEGGKRTDGRNLITELKAHDYVYAANKTEFDAIDVATTTKALALVSGSHLSYDIDRDASKEPSLADMTAKAIDILAKDNDGYFLMVEGGRIDHALHETMARKALADTVAFDAAIKVALDKVNLNNTLIVVTADHDHTLTFTGYPKRTGKTTDEHAGILGVVKNVVSGENESDSDGVPYTNLVFGNGPNRAASARNATPMLVETNTMDKNYKQESGVRLTSETHGGGDVMLMATGAGAAQFKGTFDNTKVFEKIKSAFLP